IGSSLPMEYVAAATDAPRPGMSTTGIDDAVAPPAPFRRPPASSLPQLSLFAAPRRPPAPYWSLISPSGALLPVAGPSEEPGLAIADTHATRAPPPDVPQQAGAQAWPGAQARSRYWQATHGIDTAPPPTPADDSPWATVDWQHTPVVGPM